MCLLGIHFFFSSFKYASSGINVYLCEEEPKGYILIDYFIDKEHFNKDSLP